MAEPTDELRSELATLQDRVARLEAELATAEGPAQWPPRGYYTAYYATAGFALGIFGAMASLLFNVVGSLLVGQNPLRLIQVYLTFPLGERALDPSFDSPLALAVGCCLYLATGMLLGIPFHLALTRWTPHATLAKRMALVSALAIVVWLVNFYGILSWLQPLLFGGNWIVQQIPPWVAALTHLVFGWTMALVYPLGAFVPYRQLSENS
ncbi:MAG: hypothetical protein U0836_27420 [Pirellulales bacterium]